MKRRRVPLHGVLTVQTSDRLVTDVYAATDPSFPPHLLGEGSRTLLFVRQQPPAALSSNLSTQMLEAGVKAPYESTGSVIVKRKTVQTLVFRSSSSYIQLESPVFVLTSDSQHFILTPQRLGRQSDVPFSSALWFPGRFQSLITESLSQSVLSDFILCLF